MSCPEVAPLFFLPNRISCSGIYPLPSPCDAGKAGSMLAGCPEKPVDAGHSAGNCCWWAVVGHVTNVAQSDEGKVASFCIGRKSFSLFVLDMHREACNHSCCCWLLSCIQEESQPEDKVNIMYMEAVGLREMPVVELQSELCNALRLPCLKLPVI